MKVSVVIATYNATPFIGDALESLVAQPHRPLEIVVVDDGSTDNTAQLVAHAKKKYACCGLKLILLCNRKNHGVAYARNRGLRAASGDYITILDHDDVMLPTGIEARVHFVESRGVDVVFARRDTLLHQGSTLRVEPRFEPYHTDGFTRLRSHQEQFNYLLQKRVTFGHATLLYRRSVLDRVGFFDEARELMGMEHNGWLLKLFSHYFAYYLDQSVFLIRRGHRPDHLATVWDGNPERDSIFDTVLVPRALAEIEGTCQC